MQENSPNSKQFDQDQAAGNLQENSAKIDGKREDYQDLMDRQKSFSNQVDQADSAQSHASHTNMNETWQAEQTSYQDRSSYQQDQAGNPREIKNNHGQMDSENSQGAVNANNNQWQMNSSNLQENLDSSGQQRNFNQSDPQANHFPNQGQASQNANYGQTNPYANYGQANHNAYYGQANQNPAQNTKKDGNPQVDSILNEIQTVLKRIFSKDPLSAYSIELSLFTNIAILVIMTIVNTLILGLAFNTLEIRGGFFGPLDLGDLLGGRTFAVILVLTILVGLLAAATYFLIAKFMKMEKADFNRGFTVHNITSIPVFLFMLLGLLLNAIHAVLAIFPFLFMILFIIGGVYIGIQRQMGPAKLDPFFPYLLGMAIGGTVILILISFIFGLALDSAIGSYSNSFFY